MSPQGKAAVAVLVIAILGAAGAWRFEGEKARRALADELAREITSATMPERGDALLDEAIEKIAQKRSSSVAEVQSELGRFARGDWLGQVRRGRAGALAAAIERKWSTGVRRAGEEARSTKTFAAYELAGDLARLSGDRPAAIDSFAVALEQVPDNASRTRVQLKLAQAETLQRNLDRARPLIDAAQRALEASGSSDDPLLAATLELLTHQVAGGKNADEPVLKKLVELQVRHGAESPETIDALNEAARWLAREKRNSEALRLAVQADQIEKKHSIAGVQRGLTFTILGELFWATNEPAPAENCFRQALDILNAIEPSPTATLCEALEGYARTQLSAKPANAITAIERSLKLRELLGQRDPIEEAKILRDLAQASLSQGRFREAEGPARGAFDLLERAGRIDDPEFWEISRLLGQALLGTDRPQEAEAYLRRAVKAMEKHPGKSDPVLEAETRTEWAQCINRQGATEEAAEEFRKLIAFCESRFGANSERTASAHFYLGWTQLNADQLTDAEKSLSHSLRIREKVLRSNDPLIGNCLNALGITLRRQGRPTEALRYFSRAFEMQKFDEANLSVGDVKLGANYASALTDAGHAADAVKVLYGVLAVAEKSKFRDSLALATVLNNLWRAEGAQNHMAEAEKALLAAFRILVAHCRATGERLPEEQIVIENLHDHYRHQGLSASVIEKKIDETSEF